jgi:hypothetical protein
VTRPRSARAYGDHFMPIASTRVEQNFGLRWSLGALAAGALIAALYPLFLTERTREWFYASESSIVEIATVALWIIAAVSIPVLLRRFDMRVLASMALCVAAAAREIGLDSTFTTVSVLKLRYYTTHEHPVAERALSMVVVGTLIATGIMLAIAVFRKAQRDGGLRRRWVQFALLFLVLLVGVKLLDGLPSPLKKAGLPLPDAVLIQMGSLEEHAEMVLPLLAIMAAIAFARAARRAGRASESTPLAIQGV